MFCKTVAATIFIAAAAVMHAQVNPEIPRPSPDYTIMLPGGKQTTVSAYKGKVIALEFILTTCSHCQASTKILTKLVKEYGAKGFQPLAVAINDNPEVPKFIADFGVNYPVGVAPRETVYGYLQHSVMSPNLMMPQLVFIDREGVIRAQYEGTSAFFTDQEKNMREMIEKLLAESASKKSSKKATSTSKPASHQNKKVS